MEKLYKTYDQKSKVKKQSVGGQDQFDDAHGTLRQAPKIQEDQTNGPTRLATDLNKYFNALSAAATTEKTVLEELLRENAALTTTEAELLASAASLIKANEKLSRWVVNRQKNQKTRTREDTNPRPKNLCPHCKIEVMHDPDLCFDSEKKAARRPRGWKVSCDNRGHLK